MKERLKNAELSVGNGQNLFAMSRGSFSYKQNIFNKTALKKTGITEDESGFIMSFCLPSDESCAFRLRLTEENGLYKLACICPEGSAYDRFWLTFPAEEAEHIYGCGETYSELDLKGQLVRIFVAEHQNSKRISAKMIREKFLGVKPDRKLAFTKYESYYAQPTFTSSRGYFVHADVSAYSEFDLRDASKIKIYTQQPPVLYIGCADSFPELSQKLAGLLGHQRELPDWVYDGAILAVQRGPEEIDRKIEKAVNAGVKVCGIWSQDWCGCRRTGFGYQVMWNWEQDKELYHDLPEKIKEWKARGIRFLGYINPFLAIEKDLYKYASERGYCVKDKQGADYLVTITTFPAAMIDFTNPDAYEWYKNIIKSNMIGIGMGGWMADFGEYLPVDCVLHSGEDPQLLHNRWPAIWAQLNKEAVEECGAEDDVFFFTRAGHTGTVGSSAMMWTGDQHVDWSVDDGLPSVIPATLSLAMSGFGLTHSDVGGYTTIMHMTRSKELLMRWEEMNAYSPLFRSHEGNQPDRNVQFDDDEELLAQLAKAVRVHIALKPYLKQLVKENAEKALPVMRPLFYYYDEEPAYTETTEYLLGRDILVAPVLKKGAVSRNVYLPKDEAGWTNLYTGKVCCGGGVISADAPIGKPPVFIRGDRERFRDLIEAANQK